MVPIDKVANDVAFIGKHFYALTIIKELNFDCQLSNPDDNGTYANNNITSINIYTE